MSLLKAFRAIVWSALLMSLDAIAIVVGAMIQRKKYVDSVAVVRLDQIGDFILWLTAADTLRQQYGNKKVVLLGNSAWSGLAKAVGLWDEVWPVDVRRLRTRPAYRFSIIVRISSAGFDVAVNPTHSRSFHEDDALTVATRARIRIGSTGDQANSRPWRKRISDRWYSTLAPVSGTAQHEIIRHVEFLNAVGVRNVGPKVYDLREVAAANKAGELLTPPYFVLVPGASWSGRRWPAKEFAAIADYLVTGFGLNGVICGSTKEMALGGAVAKSASAPIVNMAGRTDLVQLLSIISGAELVITNETSAVHLAATVGTPCVCILGGGHFRRFLPYPKGCESPGPLPVAAYNRMECFGCDWNCIYRVAEGMVAPCIERVGKEEVMQIARELLLRGDGGISRRLSE